MRKIRDVLRLRLALGLSQRAVGCSLGLSQAAVSEYLGRARRAGVGWPLPDGMGDEQLEALLFPPPSQLPAEQWPVPDWAWVHRELRRPNVTLALLWEEHRAAAPDGFGYSWFCDLYREWAGRLKPTLRQVHPAGERLFVVRASSSIPTVEETFGGSFGYNAKGSHSGWNMPQAILSRLGASFSSEVGPFGPHQRAAAAVAEGCATVAAIDSLVWVLLERHAPALTAALRVVGHTPDQPTPLLVGSSALAANQAERLRAALTALADDPARKALLTDVCLSGFVPAQMGDYDETLALGVAA